MADTRHAAEKTCEAVIRRDIMVGVIRANLERRATMKKLTFVALTLLAGLLLSQAPARAQMGMSGGGMRRPTRKLHKARAPVLSPSLNMLPEVSTTFEGQFLMRQLPQEQIYKNAENTRKGIEGLQGEIDKQENQIKSGIGKTGHRSMFMNYGGYYQFSKGGRRQ